MPHTDNLNIENITAIISPVALKQVFPAPPGAYELVNTARRRISDIIMGKDKAIIAVVGPCSIHEDEAALEYARKLAELSKLVSDQMLVVMRMYFEKPRTTVGWKGLVSDPDLNDTHQISKGLGIARRLLCAVTSMGLPIGTETLSTVNPQYLADLISWGSIGARTSQSQTHREMVSGLSFPVGIKNPTSGELTVALDAMRSAQSPHSFLGINHEGRIAIVKTTGNKDVHLVLRGSDEGPNYGPEFIAEAKSRLASAGLPPGIVVDCSHGNSRKKHELQADALESVIKQIVDGENSIGGFMLESFLGAGNQPLTDKLSDLKYGVSITDKCIDWDTTERLLLSAHKSLKSMGGRKL